MFDIIKSHIQKFQIIHYMIIVLAVSLQIQVTIFSQGQYSGLRVGLADIFVPFAGAYIIYSLLKNKTIWPKWTVRYMVFWLAALIIVMSIALINGYITNGFLSSWAFVNKYIGFFLLLSYLALGGWIVSNSKDMYYATSLFVTVFSGFFVLGMLLSAVTLFLQYISPFSLWLPNYPWDGFMDNRNSYMISFVMVFAFIVWGGASNKSVTPIWVNTIFWLCLPIFLMFNGSRAGWIATAILLVVFFLKKPLSRAKSVLPLLLAGALLAYSSLYITDSYEVLEGKQMRHFYDALSLAGREQAGITQNMYVGDKKRYISVEDGLELYKQSNSLLGAGLGTYRPYQEEKRGEFIDIMDFTGLWLLVEMGPLGLILFAGFFIVCAMSLYRAGLIADNNTSFHRSMLAFIILFAGLSMLHEAMYTRTLWLALGMALVTNIAGRSDKDQISNF